MNEADFLDVAFRAYTPPSAWRSRNAATGNRIIRRALVFDTETTTTAEQRFKFGFARLIRIIWDKYEDRPVYRHHHTEAEVLICADDLASLDPDGYQILRKFANDNRIEVMTRSQFAEEYVWRLCYRNNRPGGQQNTTIAGFNLPFDLSRLAYDYGTARGKDKGAFTFRMFPLVRCSDGCGKAHEHMWKPAENQYRPRLIIRHLDSKKSIIKWGSTAAREQRRKESYQGQFLDIRQLIWAVTNQATSLASACALLDLPEQYRKARTERHGVITQEYLRYARQDVVATGELMVEALKLFYAEDIQLQPTKAFSGASIAKGYLRAMGVTPLVSRQASGEPSFPTDPVVLGHCTSTFYGGRSEVHIRRTVMPVTVCDFTSMYCTINALMGLWPLVTAESATIESSAEDADWLTELCDRVAEHGTAPLLDQSLWPQLTGFAQILPDGDIVPVRATYGPETYNVGINYLHSSQPVWYAIPDILAACLLGGKTPRILSVMRLRPGTARLPGLREVRLGGTVPIDPARDDFFKIVVEQRAEIKKVHGNTSTAGSLKLLGNSGSYGTYAEFLRTDDGDADIIEAYGLHDDPWQCKPNAIEEPQEYCYPPIGSLITSGARLLLAITERLVTDAGGTWLFCDTDSLAIVTSHGGALVPCTGGPEHTANGQDAIRALTRDQVAAIRDTINQLNPYDRSKVPQLLKDETEKTNKTGQVYGYAISAKRYCLFEHKDGRPVIPPDSHDADGNFAGRAQIDDKDAYMTHGLGQYLNPADPARPEARDWMRQAWQYELDKAHGLDPQPPEWLDRPALARYTASTPHVMQAVRQWNDGKTYDERVKPFNFVLLASEQPSILDDLPQRRRFLAPYSTDPAAWLDLGWIDLANPRDSPVNLRTGYAGDRARAMVKSVSSVLAQHARHPEWKSAMPDGRVCSPDYHGLLQRRTIRVRSIEHIGKESNRMEDREADAITDVLDAYTTYPRDDRAYVKLALAGLSAYEISLRVARRSSHPIFGNPDDPLRDATYGPAGVTITHQAVSRYLNGEVVRLRQDQWTALRFVAAENLAPRLGIQPERIGYSNRHIAPETVLALWRERQTAIGSP